MRVGAESTGLVDGRASRTGETRVGRDVPSAAATPSGLTGDTAHGACPGRLIAAPGAPTGRDDAPEAAIRLIGVGRGDALTGTVEAVELPITGGCGCGAVRFEVTAPFLSAGYCHCTRCQRRSGTAASANARAERGSVRILQGEENLRVWLPEGGREKIFCVRCGSALFSRDPGAEEYTGIRLGAVDGDPGIRPESHAFVDYAATWEPIPDDGLPRYPEARPDYAEGR